MKDEEYVELYNKIESGALTEKERIELDTNPGHLAKETSRALLKTTVRPNVQDQGLYW